MSPDFTNAADTPAKLPLALRQVLNGGEFQGSEPELNYASIYYTILYYTVLY